MRKRKLPTGIQTFRKVREEGCYYVDKTAWIHQLVTQGTHYFLSRPRRFGKSLFVDTLKELFEGSEALFKGLRIHDHWDWSVRHPVVRLSFAAGSFDRRGALEADFADQMARLERLTGVSPRDYATPHHRFAGLIEALHRRTDRQVVVLVDEYDRPITEALDDAALAKANRSFLRGVYGVVKDSDALVRLSFFTGVTKFSKVSLFSDLNNLTDLTLDPCYAAVCGYTDDDLDTVFAPELDGLDRQEIRDWYDGYRWLGESVYNPWAMLLLFRSRRFKAHWFETGTPAFLVHTLVERGVGGPALESEYATEELLSAFDVEDIATEALLFQTGYLTITDEKRDDMGARYRLGCPNREVRQSLNANLLRAMSPDGAGRDRDRDRLRDLLEKDDLDGVEALFRAFFAGIPHEWHVRNDIARFEGYYASVFYSHFAGAGLDVAVEESTSRGRLDMAVRFRGRVYVFEFKMVAREGDGSAMRQIREKRYAEKHRRSGEPVHLIGVEFSETERNIVRFDVERA